MSEEDNARQAIRQGKENLTKRAKTTVYESIFPKIGKTNLARLESMSEYLSHSRENPVLSNYQAKDYERIYF